MDAADVSHTVARSTAVLAVRERSAVLEFDASPQRIEQVRRIVRAYLRYWELPHLVDHAVLAATELVTNVHLHAAAPRCALLLTEESDGSLTLAVRDRDPRPPVFHEPAAGQLAESGRGLHLLAHLAVDCGSYPDPDTGGKTVWVRLATHTSRPAPVDEPDGVAPDAVALDLPAPDEAPGPVRTPSRERVPA